MKFTLFIFVAFLFATCSYAQTPKDIKHVVVYQKNGKFAGWPANNGAWIFEGDELLGSLAAVLSEDAEDAGQREDPNGVGGPTRPQTGTSTSTSNPKVFSASSRWMNGFTMILGVTYITARTGRLGTNTLSDRSLLSS